MKRLLTHNLGFKLIALTMAVLLWIVFGRDPEVETTVSAPVQYRGLAGDLELSSPPTQNVTLEVQGASRTLEPGVLATITILLDLSHVDRAGERTFNVTPREAHLPLGIELKRAIPAQIRLDFERRVTRDIPVQARYEGALPSGYRLMRTVLSPRAVRVVGPQSHVAALTAVQTDPIDLSGIIASREGHAHAWTGDPQVRLDSPNTITWDVIVQRIRKD